MKKTNRLLTCVFFLSIFINQLKAQHNWEFKCIKDGIEVYTRQQDGSELNAIRALFEVEATLSQYASIVLNIDEYKYWNYAASNPYIIKKISKTEVIYYAEAKAPWPVTDRYVVLHLTVIQDPQSKILKITLENVPDQIPQKEGLVRVPEYYSELKVIPITKNKVKVDYFLSIDPGGSIPAWVTNLVSTKMPVNTFSNLKKRVKSQGDQRTSVAGISDE